MASPVLEQAKSEQETTEVIAGLSQQYSWVILIGRINAGVINAATSGLANVLAVLPSETWLRQLQHEGEATWPAQLTVSTQLLGSKAGECAWFLYNDSRHDGPVSPEELGNKSRNLKLMGIEIREQITLEQVLRSWEPVRAPGGAVVVIGSDPNQLALSDCDSLKQASAFIWIDHNVEVRRNGVMELDQDLATHYLYRSQDLGGSSCLIRWDRDETRALEAEHALMKTQLKEAQETIKLISARHASLEAERNQLTASTSALETELQELRDNVAALECERSALADERDNLRIELGNLQSNARELDASRSKFESECNELSAAKSALEHELQELRGNFITLEKERGALDDERNKLQQETESLQTRIDEYEERMNRINDELDAILSIIDQATPQQTA